MRGLVIIPTYNERDNIERLVPDILALDLPLEILVVDDNSPDGTGDAAAALASRIARVHTLHRPQKAGLGSAYIAGFKFALRGDYDLVFEMDADFSHDPASLAALVAAAAEADVVLGSRYLHGVTVVNWPIQRLILSYAANVYTRWVTGLPVRDATGGFKCFRRRVLEAIDLDGVRSDGYAFQIEMSYKAYHQGFRIREIPIVFTDRRVGISKMSKRIIWEAAWMVWRLRWQAVTGQLGERPLVAQPPAAWSDD